MALIAVVCLLLTFPRYFLGVAALLAGVVAALLLWIVLIQWSLSRWLRRGVANETLDADKRITDER
jgi:hypothetical protein